MIKTYDKTILQTKTCGKVADLIVSARNLIKNGNFRVNLAKKEKEIISECNGFLMQYNNAVDAMYAGCGGDNRLKRDIKKKKILDNI